MMGELLRPCLDPKGIEAPSYFSGKVVFVNTGNSMKAEVCHLSPISENSNQLHPPLIDLLSFPLNGQYTDGPWIIHSFHHLGIHPYLRIV